VAWNPSTSPPETVNAIRDDQWRNSQDLWIGVSCDLLFASLVVGSFDEFAFLEHRIRKPTGAP